MVAQLAQQYPVPGVEFDFSRWANNKIPAKITAASFLDWWQDKTQESVRAKVPECQVRRD